MALDSDSGREPMPPPPRLGSAIQIRQGVRRLLPEELTRGLGVLAGWGGPNDLSLLPAESPAWHSHLQKPLAELPATCSKKVPKDPTSSLDDQPSSSAPSAKRPGGELTTYRLELVKPDLSPGSPRHLARIYNLIDSCKGLRDRK
jgi:hypothetical protein